MARAALIAGLYVALTALVLPLSFGVPLGPVVIELRISEALAVLPLRYPESVPALFVGVWLANLMGGLGPWDVWGGSLVTLLAAYLTWRHRRHRLAVLWPVAANGLLVSAYLSVLLGLPYWATAIGITASEALVVLGLGMPLLRLLDRRVPS
ncbi:QueT transporter family protein [Geochorda subterranea]|uniref:QueT transporter family protein n=1 Tax=Geochorda subterranea TaxID=3109564 RepID=A0ABZ1BQ44_9FIRM|nr:QueT transporter family protein [Limnochorda sp. LNt]WRP14676.1 QueT transporter family protein [Limnochorda sp. LNt]